jgi:hypothetical protein
VLFADSCVLQLDVVRSLVKMLDPSGSTIAPAISAGGLQTLHTLNTLQGTATRAAGSKQMFLQWGVCAGLRCVLGYGSLSQLGYQVASHVVCP